MTDSCLLHKMRVSCSACADWPRSLQKHKQAQRRTTLALISTQVTRGRDAERLLTRERLLHTHSACLSTAARAYSSERYALLQSAKRKQLISPAPRRGSESGLSFTANPNTRGFGRGYSTNQARDLKMDDYCTTLSAAQAF